MLCFLHFAAATMASLEIKDFVNRQRFGEPLKTIFC